MQSSCKTTALKVVFRGSQDLETDVDPRLQQELLTGMNIQNRIDVHVDPDVLSMERKFR